MAPATRVGARRRRVAAASRRVGFIDRSGWLRSKFAATLRYFLRWGNLVDGWMVCCGADVSCFEVDVSSWGTLNRRIHIGFFNTRMTESPRRKSLLMKRSLFTGFAFFWPLPV